MSGHSSGQGRDRDIPGRKSRVGKIVGHDSRKRRIAELRDYATRNFDQISRNALGEIKREGWVPADDEDFEVEVWNQPSINRRGMAYRRPWGDFLLTLIERAQEDYYVTEATAKSYSEETLRPFRQELLSKEWRDPKRDFMYKPLGR